MTERTLNEAKYKTAEEWAEEWEYRKTGLTSEQREMKWRFERLPKEAQDWWNRWFNAVKLAANDAAAECEAFNAARAANHMWHVGGKKKSDIPDWIALRVSKSS